jgi:hypothetical protein
LLSNFLRRHIRSCISPYIQNPKLARWSSGLKSAQGSGSSSLDAMLSLLNLYARTGFADEGEPNTRTTPKVAIVMRVHNVQYNGAARINQPPCCLYMPVRAHAACSNFSTALEMKRILGPLIRLLLCAHKTLCTKHRPVLCIYVCRSSFNEIIKAFSCVYA